MTMQHLHLPSLKSIFILSLIAVISACGSDGGKKPPVVVPDTTPSAFSFTAVTGAAVSSEVTSAAITIAGIDTATAISITGGTYAIGTGAFTASAGTVTTGQTVKVKVTTSASNSTAVTATLTVGGITGSFSVTTVADTTPNAFIFAAATAAQPGSANTSAAIIVVGIDAAAPISITGGTYAIDGGTYTAEAGSVTVGKSITVKATAAATPSTATDTVLTIGGVSATYKVTTVAETTPPTAQILFPPVVSMTEGNTILVRGTASDAYSIKSVKVKLNGVSTTATTTDGFANWQATVPLTYTTIPVIGVTENTLTVVTEDDAGNVASDAAHVAIRQAPIASSFPDSVNKFGALQGLVVDNLDGRNRLLTVENNEVIRSVDLTTGTRTIFADYTGTAINGLTSLVINPINKHLFAADTGSPGNLMDIDLTNSSQYQIYSSNLYSYVGSLALNGVGNYTKIVSISYDDGVMVTTNQAITSFEVFSDANTNKPDAINSIKESYGMAFDTKRNRYLVLDDVQQTIFAVDAVTGGRSVFSNNTTGTGDSFGNINLFLNTQADGAIRSIAIDEINQRAIVTEVRGGSGSGMLYSVDLATGNRTLISGATSSNPYNVTNRNSGIAISDSNSYAFLSDATLKAIVAIDLVTGHRVVFSK